MIRLTQEQFIEKLLAKYPGQLDTSLVNYKNHQTKIQLVCLKHGSFFTTPNSVLCKNISLACPFCNNSKLNKDLFLEKANKRHDFKYGYDKIPEIFDSFSYIDIYCPDHKGYFNQRVTNHLTGSTCNYCCYTINKSKGEVIVEKYLKDNNIKYIREYKIKNELRKRSYLRFDFYLPDYNMVIEFDGKQHFFHIEHFGSESSFERIKENDIYKNNYCEINNIVLLRIPSFLKNNIHSIINHELNKITNNCNDSLFLGTIYLAN